MAAADRGSDPAADADDGEARISSSSEEEEEGGVANMRVERQPTPSYPFPADFQLEFGGSHIMVCQHLCRQHPEGTRAVAMFFPGVHGGVGCCRTPGETFDDAALFPTVARRLIDSGVDCYRCSWPFMRPRMAYAVGAACRVLHHALLEAFRGGRGDGRGAREIRVFIIGHSLGGAVAIQAAEVIARHFGPDGTGGQAMEGLEDAVVRLAGICTLNGALDVGRILHENKDPFASLRGCRALLICGDADEAVPPEATRQLCEALPMEAKRHLVLPGGTHDLYTHKERLVQELCGFLVGAGGRGEEEARAETEEAG